MYRDAEQQTKRTERTYIYELFDDVYQDFGKKKKMEHDLDHSDSNMMWCYCQYMTLSEKKERNPPMVMNL